MKSLLEHAEEMSRHIDLRDFGENLGLLKVPNSTSAVPIPLVPIPTLPVQSTLPATRAATPKTTPTPTITQTAEPPSKRPADEIIGDSKKRRKVGEP